MSQQGHYKRQKDNLYGITSFRKVMSYGKRLVTLAANSLENLGKYVSVLNGSMTANTPV